MVGGGDGVCYGSEVAQSTDDEMPTKSQASLCGRVKQWPGRDRGELACDRMRQHQCFSELMARPNTRGSCTQGHLGSLSDSCPWGTPWLRYGSAC